MLYSFRRLTGKILLTFTIVLFPLAAGAEEMTGEKAPAEAMAPQVMMIGVFHFSNPGRDVVKSEVTNVMAEDSQAYLQALAQRITDSFRPTRVLLEYEADSEERIQQRYRDYLKGEFELRSNEIYQLGFRIGATAGGIPIQGFDDTSLSWQAEPLFEIMAETAPEINDRFQQLITLMGEQQTEDHSTKTLPELLRQYNSPEYDRLNKDTYLLLNPVATPGNYEGPESATSWWGRNFRMYANIQRAAGPGERVLVIAGQGHTAIMRDFLEIDTRIEAVDPRPLF